MSRSRPRSRSPRFLSRAGLAVLLAAAAALIGTSMGHLSGAADCGRLKARRCRRDHRCFWEKTPGEKVGTGSCSSTSDPCKGHQRKRACKRAGVCEWTRGSGRGRARVLPQCSLVVPSFATWDTDNDNAITLPELETFCPRTRTSPVVFRAIRQCAAAVLMEFADLNGDGKIDEQEHARLSSSAPPGPPAEAPEAPSPESPDFGDRGIGEDDARPCSWPAGVSLPDYPTPTNQYEPLISASPDIVVQNVVDNSAPLPPGTPGYVPSILTACNTAVGPCCDLSDIGNSDGEAKLNKCFLALGDNLYPVGGPVDPECAGVGCGASGTSSGKNANLNTMGLITHGWDSGEDNNFKNGLPEVWRPGCHGQSADLGASVGVRWSTSIVNRLSMTNYNYLKPNGSLPAMAIYNLFSGGVILNPKHVQINCLFSGDGGTDARNYNGCGKHFSTKSNLTLGWDWCDRGYGGGNTGMANGSCVGAPTQLNSMFQSQKVFGRLFPAVRQTLRTAYNEAVVLPLGSTKDKPEGLATTGTPIAAFYTPMSQNRASYPGGTRAPLDYVDPNLLPCNNYGDQPYPYKDVDSGTPADGVPTLCLSMSMGTGKVAVNGTGLKCCQQKGDPDAATYTFPQDSVKFPGGCEGMVSRRETMACIADLLSLTSTKNEGTKVVTCQAMCNFYKELQSDDASTGACNSKPAGCPPLLQMDMFPLPGAGPFKILCKDYKECFDKKVCLHSPSTCTINP